MMIITNVSACMSLFFIFSMFNSLVTIDTNSTIGFTVDLIHRDSPQSPSFNSSLSSLQRFVNTLQRSSNRAEYFKLKYSKKTPIADIISHSGIYFIRYSIGTPPLPSFADADTGSDLIWTQCQPCVQCFKQKTPIFEPSSSSTFKKVSCVSLVCVRASNSVCGDLGRICLYSESYKDKSYTKGIIATETLTLDSTEGESLPLPDIIFGCATNNSGIFLGVESGIVGLGGGKNSLVGQLNNRIGGKFSYCLVSYLSTLTTSKLNFGSNAVVSGPGVVSTPIVPKYPRTFYYLTLDGISIENERFDSSKHHREGNIIIDSGSTVTSLPYILYDRVYEVAKNLIYLRRVRDPARVLKLCYFTEENIEFPDITFHFRGADVKLGANSTFIRTGMRVMCLAFKPTEDTAIFGNLQQTNFLIGYDLNEKTVSFKPKDCSIP